MKSIFVGNLDFGTTEDSIRNLFEQHGAVERVNVIRDRDTGQPRGFAFVEMADSSEADRAIMALNGANLDGRAINVNEARPRAERAGFGGGGGGGFRSGNRSGGGGGRPSGGGGRGGRREPRW
ncbi:MAG TPA: RNA-binding protein [Bryobacteraceae bacterium]